LENIVSEVVETDSLSSPFLCASLYVGGSKAWFFANTMAREFGLSQLPDKRVSDWVEQRWQKQDSTGLVNISLYSLSNEYSSRGQAKKLALLQIVQANDSTAIVASWEDFRSRLLEAINVARLFSDTGTSEHLRIINSDQFAGYSLVYGANSTSLLISPDRSPKRLAADLQKVVKGLSGRDVEKPIRLETENISDAHHTALLSLINVPTGLERDAGIIYWMIKDEDDSIFVKWCLSPHSRLSQVETLAHKTFAHSYQLKLLRPRWEETIERLLLNNTNLHDIAELDNTVSSLDSINNNVGSLLRIHPIAEAANSTIHQQLANMAIVRNQLYDNAIFQYLELLMRNDSNDAQLYTLLTAAIATKAATIIVTVQRFLKR
jgi:hypothetical protein